MTAVMRAMMTIMIMKGSRLGLIATSAGDRGITCTSECQRGRGAGVGVGARARGRGDEV